MTREEKSKAIAAIIAQRESLKTKPAPTIIRREYPLDSKGRRIYPVK